jgi:hypothetical protein
MFTLTVGGFDLNSQKFDNSTHWIFTKLKSNNGKRERAISTSVSIECRKRELNESMKSTYGIIICPSHIYDRKQLFDLCSNM